MRPAPEPPSIESLLAHTEWVRALARRLVADPSAADDATQEVWLAASRGRARRGGDPRAWLARVLRNVRFAERRASRARARRERAHARPERDPAADPARVAELVELHQRVVAALLALDEPFREALLLRYFAGLEPERIARELGLPASTVRGRIQRGLTRLRERLGGGDERNLALLLAPLAGASKFSKTAAVTAAGALLMQKLAIVGGALALFVAGAWWWVERADHGLAPASDEASPPAVVARTTPSEARAEEAASLERIVRGDAPSRAALDAPEAIALEGVVTTRGTGAPIANVRIALEDVAGRAVGELARSDERGHYALARGPQVGERLAFFHDEHLRRRVSGSDVPRGEGARLDVELFPLGTLEATVVDPSGKPLEGRSVEATAFFDRLASPRFAPETSMWSARTLADGRATFADLPCGVPIGIGFERGEWIEPLAIDPTERRASARLVWLPRGTVAGRLVRADASPADGFELELLRTKLGALSPASHTRSESDGSFQFDEVAPGEIAVRAEIAGSSIRRALVEPGARCDLGELALPELARFAGRLTCSAEIDFGAVSLELWRGGERLGEPLWLDREGRFETRVAPGISFVRAALHQRMYVDREDGVFVPQSRGELGELWRGELEAPAEALELGIDEGVGFVEARFPGLAGAQAKASFVFRRGDHEVAQLPRALEEGRVRSLAMPIGGYELSIEVPQSGRIWMPDFELRAGANALGELDFAKAALAGRVVDASGAAVAHALVTLDAPGVEGARGERETDGDGRFRFDALEPARWRAVATGGELGRSAEQWVGLRAGVAEEIELELLAPARLTGRVTRRGEPVAAMQLGLCQPSSMGALLQSLVVTGAAGEFACDTLPPGPYVLFAGVVSTAFELAPGEAKSLAIELEDDSLELEVLGAEGANSVQVLCIDPGSPRFGICATGLLEQGVATVEHPHVRSLVLANVPGVGRLAALFEAGAVAGRASVRMSERRLELVTGSPDAPPPELVLVGTTDSPEMPLHPLPAGLARVRGALGGWSYFGIPDGARLELRGVGARGEPLVRSLLAPEAMVFEARWP